MAINAAFEELSAHLILCCFTTHREGVIIDSIDEKHRKLLSRLVLKASFHVCQIKKPFLNDAPNFFFLCCCLQFVLVLTCTTAEAYQVDSH